MAEEVFQRLRTDSSLQWLTYEHDILTPYAERFRPHTFYSNEFRSLVQARRYKQIRNCIMPDAYVPGLGQRWYMFFFNVSCFLAWPQTESGINCWTPESDVLVLSAQLLIASGQTSHSWRPNRFWHGSTRNKESESNVSLGINTAC